MALVAPATRSRLARWPIVGAIDALLTPLLTLVQKNLSAAPTSSIDPDAYLDAPRAVASSVQATFAQLHQSHPLVGALYRQRKLWEPTSADLAAAGLRRRLSSLVQHQRAQIMRRAAGRFGGALLAPLRWLLTIGAVLWFPFLQPVLEVMLQQDAWGFSKETLLLVVRMLSVTHLLQCAAFLLIWFLVLWAYLRFSTQRRVARQIDGWKSADAADERSLAGQTMQWIDEMLDPIRQRRRRVESLAARTEELRQSISARAPAEPIPA
jgi:hypothetical protein